MADCDKSVVIVPNGHIGKCEHFSEDHFVGHIESEELDTKMIQNFQETHEEISICSTCFDYPNCIWLKLCKNHQKCYQEERTHKHYIFQQSITKAYLKYKDNLQNEAQD
jgi:radical SAM protein with 4Fe4S-binding SPASM domain